MNRKKKMTQPTYNYKGNDYLINTGKYNTLGIYAEIMQKILEQLDISIAIHKRILVLRIDLHQKEFTENNKLISKYINAIKMFLNRNYGIYNIGFIWVRELSTKQGLHYHLALLLDGNKIQFPSKLHEALSEKWAKNGRAYRVGFKNNYLQASIESLACPITTDKKDSLIYWLSYLAKSNTKGKRENQVSDYQASRLKL